MIEGNMMINFKIYMVSISIFLFAGCLEEVSNVPREKLEATLIVVRNEGNSNDEVDLYLDSLLIGKTFQDKISEVIIPAGDHTIWFDYAHDHYGTKMTIKPNAIYATRQFVLEAYSFTRVAFDSLNEDSLNKFMKDTLPKIQYKYYEATQKINTRRFNQILRDFEECSLEIREINPKK
jgi:hypothetical protein